MVFIVKQTWSEEAKIREMEASVEHLDTVFIMSQVAGQGTVQRKDWFLNAKSNRGKIIQ